MGDWFALWASCFLLFSEPSILRAASILGHWKSGVDYSKEKTREKNAQLTESKESKQGWEKRGDPRKIKYAHYMFVLFLCRPMPPETSAPTHTGTTCAVSSKQQIIHPSPTFLFSTMPLKIIESQRRHADSGIWWDTPMVGRFLLLLH